MIQSKLVVLENLENFLETKKQEQRIILRFEAKHFVFFIKFIKKKKRLVRVRVAVAYQGKIKDNKRNKLINKKVFLKTFLKGRSCNTYEYSL